MTTPPFLPTARAQAEEDWYARVVDACVRLHRRQMPLTPESLNGEIPDLTVTQARKLLESDKLVGSLAARGVTFVPVDALTAHQLHALTIYLDTSVPMTHRERLRAAKVTQVQWDGWMRNPRFQARLEEVSEERMAASNPLTLIRLMEAVDAGQRWAIELSLEMTGRHRRNQDGQNVAELFAAVFQVLDEAQVPQEVMQVVGQRFMELANPGSAPARAAATILAPNVSQRGREAASITGIEE